MKPAWLGRCALRCVAAAAATVPPATWAQVAPVADPLATDPPAAAADSHKSKLQWGRVCALSLNGGQVSLHCDLTLELVRELDRSPIAVDGLAGTTTLEITPPRLYRARNVQRVGDADVEVSVTSARGTLTLQMDRTVEGRMVRVLYTQFNSDFSNRRSVGRNDMAQLTVTGGPGDLVGAGAADFVTLRKERPHEVNRYLRPLLRQVGAEGLMTLEPAAARQVLFVTDEAGAADGTTRPASVQEAKPAVPVGGGGDAAGAPPAVPPWADRAAVEAAVRPLLDDLKSPGFARRQAAADRLAALGPPAAAALARVDRRTLSAQQRQEVDLIASATSPLSPDDVRQLRDDPHFLIDCLYAPDAAIRSAAADRLRAVAKATPTQLARARLAAGRPDDPAAAFQAIEDLRDELLPKVK